MSSPSSQWPTSTLRTLGTSVSSAVPADNLPMAGRLVEWRVTDSGWVQVTRDADRAGSALLNFAVDDWTSTSPMSREGGSPRGR